MKKGSQSTPRTSPPPRNPRLFAGVRSSTLAAFVAFSAAGTFVLVPRPTFPHTFPLPQVEERKGEKFDQAERARAVRVRDGSLSPAVRAVGEQLRRAGAQVAASGAVDDKLLSSLRADAGELADGDAREVESLKDLRALQTEMFISAAKSYLDSREADTELLELGGEFHRTLKSAWLDQNGQSALSINELRVLFRVHWLRLTGLARHPEFKMNVDELRRYYATNLRHPPVAASDYHAKAMSRIQFARGLGKVDPTYPAALTIAILSLQLGEPLKAEKLLREFLKVRPDGEWGAVARNFLRRAVLEGRDLQP